MKIYMYRNGRFAFHPHGLLSADHEAEVVLVVGKDVVSMAKDQRQLEGQLVTLGPIERLEGWKLPGTSALNNFKPLKEDERGQTIIANPDGWPRYVVMMERIDSEYGKIEVYRYEQADFENKDGIDALAYLVLNHSSFCTQRYGVRLELMQGRAQGILDGLRMMLGLEGS